MYKKFLDLGKQPLANKFLTKAEISKKEDFYNLSIGFNKKNNLVSILKTISSKRMFNDKYPYRSSMSETMKNYFYELSKKIMKEFNPSSEDDFYKTRALKYVQWNLPHFSRYLIKEINT